MQKTPYVFPLVGGNKIEQLQANIYALRVVLTDEQIKEIESAIPFDAGFPSKYIVRSFSFTFARAIHLMPARTGRWVHRQHE